MKNKFQKFFSFLVTIIITIVFLLLIEEVSLIYAAKTFNLGASGDTINIPGVVNLGTVSGSYSGTINSANVSSGSFGFNTGGGNYSFPADLSFVGTLTGGSVPWARITGFTGDTIADTIADDGVITLGTETSGSYVVSESDPTVASSVKDGVSWSELSGIPAGFSDNNDNDTTYSAGTGISIVGTTISNTGVISESDPKVGSLSSNYLSKWGGSALSNSSIYDDGTNVGIGTTDKGTYKLNVAGNIKGDRFIGYGAGGVISNSAVGSFALYSNTTGYSNTANGMNALYSNTTGYTNTANGNGSLYNNTTGNFNTANGATALYSNTTGSSNTANGYQSLRYNTTGYTNTANGEKALYSNTTGSYNTANGETALYSNTTSSFNTANGATALYNNTTGYSNTANGYGSLRYNTTGNFNTANGEKALYFNTEGNYNTANGANALYNNTGYYNTALGYRTLYSNTTSCCNTANGFNALYNNTGYYNTANGYRALYSNTTGTNNTANGMEALYNNTGSYNTALGYRALYSNITGSYNTALGYGAGPSTNALTNATVIGYNAVVDASNKVRIGNTSVTVIEGQVMPSASSDKRQKENIQDYTYGLDFISKLHPVSFTFKTDDTKKIHSGFIAQEVEAIGIPFYGLNRPESKDGYYSLSYSEFVVPLVNSVKELKAENDKLKSDNDDLHIRIERLEAKIK